MGMREAGVRSLLIFVRKAGYDASLFGRLVSARYERAETRDDPQDPRVDVLARRGHARPRQGRVLG